APAARAVIGDRHLSPGGGDPPGPSLAPGEAGAAAARPVSRAGAGVVARGGGGRISGPAVSGAPGAGRRGPTAVPADGGQPALRRDPRGGVAGTGPPGTGREELALPREEQVAQEVPENLQQMIEQQLERLHPEEQRVLE